MNDDREMAATPHAELIDELMNPNNPKNEREHAAVREIERLQEALALPVQSASGKVTDAEVDRAWAIASTRDMMEYALQDFVANRIEALAQPVQEPVSAAEIQRLRFLVDSKNLDKLYRDLHLVEEICEFYAKCDLSVEALRDWVSERMDTPPLPVQEPVAWVCEGCSSDEKHAIDYWQDDVDDIPIGTQLYTTPPQRQWVGLTGEEKAWCAAPTYLETVARVEAKLKEKNT